MSTKIRTVASGRRRRRRRGRRGTRTRAASPSSTARSVCDWCKKVALVDKLSHRRAPPQFARSLEERIARRRVPLGQRRAGRGGRASASPAGAGGRRPPPRGPRPAPPRCRRRRGAPRATRRGRCWRGRIRGRRPEASRRSVPPRPIPQVHDAREAVAARHRRREAVLGHSDAAERDAVGPAPDSIQREGEVAARQSAAHPMTSPSRHLRAVRYGVSPPAHFFSRMPSTPQLTWSSPTPSPDS